MVAPIRILLTFGKWTLMDWKDMLLAIVNDSLRIDPWTFSGLTIVHMSDLKL